MSCLKTKAQFLHKVSLDKHIKRMVLARSKLSGDISDSQYSSKCRQNSSGSNFSENIQNDHTKLKSKGQEQKTTILQQSNSNPTIGKTNKKININKFKPVQQKKPDFMQQKENESKNQFNKPRASTLPDKYKISDIQKTRSKNISNNKEKFVNIKLDTISKLEQSLKSLKRDIKTTKENGKLRNEKTNAKINHTCESTKRLNTPSSELLHKFHKTKNIPIKINPQNSSRKIKAPTKCVLTQRSRVDEKWLNHREKGIGDMANNITNKELDHEAHVLSEKDLAKKVYKSNESNLFNFINRNISSSSVNENESNTASKNKILNRTPKKNYKIQKYSERSKSLEVPFKDSSLFITGNKKDTEDLGDCNTENNTKIIEQKTAHHSYDSELDLDVDELTSEEVEHKDFTKETDIVKEPNTPAMSSTKEQVDQECIQPLTDEEYLSSENYSISSSSSDNCCVVPEVRAGDCKQETHATFLHSLEDKRPKNFVKSNSVSSPDSLRKNFDRSQLWIQFAKAYAENSNIYRRKRQLHRAKLFDKPVLNLGTELNLTLKDL